MYKRQILTGLLGIGVLAGFRVGNKVTYLKLQSKIKHLYVLGFMSMCFPLVVMMSAIAAFYSYLLHIGLFLGMLACLARFLYLVWEIRKYENVYDTWPYKDDKGRSTTLTIINNFASDRPV